LKELAGNPPADAPFAAGGNPKAAGPRRLFILRPDHLGDLVLFSGALREIRKRWPAAHITLCVRKYGRELFGACPYVDELFPYEQLRRASPINRIPWFPGSRRVRQALQECIGGWMRERFSAPLVAGLECDLAVLPLRSPEEEYHWLMRMVPAAARLGVAGSLVNQSRRAERIARPFYSAQLDGSKLPEELPEFEMTRDFLRFIGIDVEVADLWPEFWTKEEDAQRAARLMARGGAGERLLGIAPGNLNPGKKLAPAWFARVFEHLKGESFHVVLLGSKGDLEDCAGVEHALRGLGNVAGLRNLTGMTSVREMIECLKRCDLVLAQETAALHMAAGLRKPVLGIVGGGHYGRFYPWGDPEIARVATNKMDCFGCNWECRYKTMRCIQDIPPESVAAGLRALLAGAGRAA